ncbi:unnamed protein product [Prunus armeniaca]|uniref:PGG domain-containing protein n=1 Tax=Prunus armeniaca TaxID=36596 RepID=A0A6J5X1A6_PRUAR|nr:unnamed protein product [Prunus armeniaca]CAB4307509.1 unnamed protein product [Prunus armeniaca]
MFWRLFDTSTLNLWNRLGYFVSVPLFQQQIRRDFEKPEAPVNNTSAKITNTRETPQFYSDCEMERRDTTLLVATLISTVTFAAGFTIPGGLKSDGKAVLDGSAYFKVFMCSNIVSFFLSAFVIYNELLEESFLAIQTVALVLRCSVGGLVFAFFSGFMAVQDNKGKGSPTETRMKREGKICLQDHKI